MYLGIALQGGFCRAASKGYILLFPLLPAKGMKFRPLGCQMPACTMCYEMRSAL
jgi:hypothetical protein